MIITGGGQIPHQKYYPRGEAIELKIRAHCKTCGVGMFKKKTYCSYCLKYLEWYENSKEVWAIRCPECNSCYVSARDIVYISIRGGKRTGDEIDIYCQKCGQYCQTMIRSARRGKV